jgi:hypothetical protein
MLASNYIDPSACLVPPASSRLPVELLQQIYYLLIPFDFDAARHTSRLWFVASLDKSLLGWQLKQGGWHTGAEQDIQEAAEYLGRKSRRSTAATGSQGDFSSGCQSVSAEWILSKRLAAETRLCPKWRGGNPLDNDPSDLSSGRAVALHTIKSPTPKLPALRGARPSVPPATFTVSGCKKFVLCAQDRVVFIYALHNFKRGMTPLTSMFCHRRVVKVSMDTSCGRYAVAILLEGRIGLCCEVNMGKRSTPPSDRIHPSMSLSDFRNFDVRTTSRTRILIGGQDQLDFDLSSTRRSQISPQAAAYRRRGHTLGGSGDTTFMRGSSLKLTDSNVHHGSGEEFNPPVPNASYNQFFPNRFSDDGANQSLSRDYLFNNFDPLSSISVSIELGARRTYKNLCSVHDPPKSVAICPQRQCVAFGCKTGVELHWIDALRGSTLSR